MLKNKPVTIVFKCSQTTLGSFEDLVSKEGHEHIQREGFRHYAICQAPRIIFKSFEREEEKIKIKIQRDVTEFEEISVSIVTSVIFDGVETEISHIESTNYPEIKVTLDNGIEVRFKTCFEFLGHTMQSNHDILTHEVIYIGKTKTTENYLRLKSHSKLTAIAECNLKSKPQHDIFIKLFKFDDPIFICYYDEEPVNPEWAVELIKEIGEFTPDQITNLIEAFLIRGFDTEYNDQLSKSVPNKLHDSYNFIFDKPIDTIVINIDESNRKYLLKIGEETKRICNFITPLQPGEK